MQVKNIPAICESIMLFDVMQKRKVCVDAISEGLELFKLRTAIEIFPEQFKHFFILKQCVPSDIVGCLHFSSCSGQEKRIEGLIKKTIETMDNSGTIYFCVAICELFIY